MRCQEMDGVDIQAKHYFLEENRHHISLACVSATSYENLSEGTYCIDAFLSCYINAMGGVEFGVPLLESSQINIDADGRTLYFTKSSVTIYSVTCDTFIDVSPSYITETNGIKSGMLGFYDKNGVLNTEDIKCTLREDTAENARQE